MIKTVFAVVLAVAVYVALGAVAPSTGAVALVLLPTFLGALGAITFKGVIALGCLGAVAKS